MIYQRSEILTSWHFDENYYVIVIYASSTCSDFLVSAQLYGVEL